MHAALTLAFLAAVAAGPLQSAPAQRTGVALYVDSLPLAQPPARTLPVRPTQRMPGNAIAAIPAAGVHVDSASADRRQQERPLSITVDEANGYRPVVRVGPVFGDTELERAATSGLPLRVRVRVELWKDRFFDQLVDTTSWSTVIVHEPIGDQFFVRSLPATRGARRASTFASARQAIESEYLLSMRPADAGRYYYTVSLQIETLSVSDLEELERWLQGELQPAVSGERSFPGAVGQGARRLMLRILDLPERRYDARTGRFRVNG